MFDTILRNHVFIDFGADYRFTDEQINLTYPTRFPVVRFQLMVTSLLVSLVDRMRKDAGFTPFYPVDEYTESMCDQEGWYDFYIGLNGWSDTKVDGCIEAVVCNSCSADDGELYTLDLTHDEQLLMYSRLDEQCRKHLGKSCEELLMDARAEMHRRWKDESHENDTPENGEPQKGECRT